MFFVLKSAIFILAVWLGVAFTEHKFRYIYNSHKTARHSNELSKASMWIVAHQSLMKHSGLAIFCTGIIANAKLNPSFAAAIGLAVISGAGLLIFIISRLWPLLKSP